jgi:hypothetical protein
VRIPSWQLTHSAEPFCNVSRAPVLYALPHLRQHHRPSVTEDGSKGVDAILSTLHVILRGGGDADTGPGFKARTRISHSCLGHPARRPVPVRRRDQWRCAARATVRRLSAHRPSLAEGLRCVWACCSPVSVFIRSQWSRMQSRHLTHSTALPWAFDPLSTDFAHSVRERAATNWLHNVYVHYTMLLRVSAILFWPSSGSCRYNRRVQRIWQFVIDEFQAIYMCVCMCVCVYIYICHLFLLHSNTLCFNYTFHQTLCDKL